MAENFKMVVIILFFLVSLPLEREFPPTLLWIWSVLLKVTPDPHITTKQLLSIWCS